MYEVIFFTTDKGTKPVLDFIKNIPDTKARAKIFAYIDRLEEAGFLPEPYSKPIRNVKKLRELRISFLSNIFRIFYFMSGGGKIILLHGFVKKGQKTPQREIEIAKKRMIQYLGE